MELHIASQKLFGFQLHRHVHRHLRDHFIPHAGNNYKPHTLHHRALFLYSAFLILLKLAVLSSPIFLPYNLALSSAVTSENIVGLTNQSRSDFNLEQLTVSPKLSVAAENKAHDMMQKAYFAHFSPTGVSPWYWIVQSGYNYSYAGENLAIRFSSAEGVNEAWLASPAHRANILSSQFKEIGVAVLTDSFGEEGNVTLVVEMFGTQNPTSQQPNTTAPKKSIAAPVTKSPKLPENPAPSESLQILFPLTDSYVNQEHFTVLGNASSVTEVGVYVDKAIVGSASTTAKSTFEFLMPQTLSISDGNHALYATATIAGKNLVSNTVNFILDTTVPAVLLDNFSLEPVLGKASQYNIRVTGAEDSIRTIATLGSESVVLEKQKSGEWSGTLTLNEKFSNGALPVEILTQDMAGNQNRQRVGWLQSGNVAGVFNFVSDEPAKTQFSVLGLFTINDFSGAVKSFYLYFAVFLSMALILKIAIKRHIQHPKTIVGAASVMMLAMILFAF